MKSVVKTKEGELKKFMKAEIDTDFSPFRPDMTAQQSNDFFKKSDFY